MSTPLRNINDSPPAPTRRYPPPSSPPPPLARTTLPNSGTTLPSATSTLSSLSLGTPRSHRKPKASSNGINADEAVRSTDSDALLSRISAIRAGYLPPDPFSEALVNTTTQRQAAWKVVPGTGGGAVPVASHVAWRRPPVINIGTYLRCAAVDQVIHAFVLGQPELPGLGPDRPITLRPFVPTAEPPVAKGENPVQIISLGAGSDSRLWKLKADPTLGPRVARYVELDFEQVTKAKVDRILHSDTLAAPFQGMGLTVSPDGQNLDVDQFGYHLMACDVRDLVAGMSTARTSTLSNPTSRSMETLRAALRSMLDPNLPTIVVLECFLLYLDPSVSQALLTYLLSDLLSPSPRVSVVSYDVVLSGNTSQTRGRPTVSEFGQVMLANLGARGLEIPGAKAATLPGDHTHRLVSALGGGFPLRSAEQRQVRADTTALSSIFTAIPPEAKARLSQVEGLDELEELKLLLQHYTISVAQRS